MTLEDILEEIVGEFTSDFAANMPEILPQEDGSYVIDGMAVYGYQSSAALEPANHWPQNPQWLRT